MCGQKLLQNPGKTATDYMGGRGMEGQLSGVVNNPRQDTGQKRSGFGLLGVEYCCVM